MRLSFVCLTCDGHDAVDVTLSVRSTAVAATTVPVSLSVNGMPAGGAGASSCAAFCKYGNGDDRLAAVRVHLEMQVRVDAVRIARVAEVADELSRVHVLAVDEAGCVRDAGDALALVVVTGRQIVVQMDVLVHRPAYAVQVEHAAGAGGRRPELDSSFLDCDDRRALHAQQVVALVRAARAGLAEVVRIGHRADDGEEELRNAALRGGGAGARKGEGDDEDRDQAPHPGHRSRVFHRCQAARGG